MSQVVDNAESALPTAEQSDAAKLTSLERALLVIVVLIGAAMRLWWLAGVPPINGDECWLSSVAYASGHGVPTSWMEPNRHIADPLFMVPLVGLHLLFPPTILLARSVSVIGGLLTLPINYYLCRRAFGKPTALITTMLVAAFPAAIAYSRLGWETVQSMPACLAVLYCAVLMSVEPARKVKWAVWTVVSAAIAFMIYPVCATIAPLIAGVMLCSVWPAVRKLSKSTRGLSVLGAAAGAILVAIFVAFNVVRRIWPLPTEPIADPMRSLWMALGTGSFVSGLTISRYFTGQNVVGSFALGGTSPIMSIPDAAFTLLLFVAGIVLLIRAKGPLVTIDRFLGVGIALSLFFMFAMAGVGTVGTAYNRMLVPISATILVMMARALILLPGTRRPLFACAILCAYYFAWLGITYFGPAAHAMSRSGQSPASLDPNVQIVRYLDSQSENSDIYVVAKKYFGYEPVHYLTLQKPHIHTYYETDFEKLPAGTVRAALAGGHIYTIAVGPQDTQLMRAGLASASQKFTEFTPVDYEGRPGNTVFRILAR